MSAELLALIAASASIVGAIVLGVAHRVRRTRRLDVGLGSPDPAARVAALVEVERDGVAAHATRLVTQIASERDERVLDAIAQLVRRDQWEPLVSPQQRALRSWAAERRAPASATTLLDPTVFVELEAALGQPVRRVTVAGRHGRIVVLRDDDMARPSGRRWRS